MTGSELLPPRERAVYLLRAAGKRNRDIAIELGMSRQNVGTTYGHALARLRRARVSTYRYAPAEIAAESLRLDRHAARDKPCAACHLRGHVAGDPDRCWPAVRAQALIARAA